MVENKDTGSKSAPKSNTTSSSSSVKGKGADAGNTSKSASSNGGNQKARSQTKTTTSNSSKETATMKTTSASGKSSSSGKATKTRKPKSEKRVKTEQEIRVLAPIILAFFVSGLVGMVGAVSGYVKEDFNLSNTVSSLLVSAIYFWFLIMAVPTGYIMDKMGHKGTVILALGLSCLSLVIPIVYYSYFTMIISLCLLGIANTMLQISLNLLVSDVTPKRQLSSMLTLGQFVGQIPAMVIPMFALWAVAMFGSWRWVYPVFLLISLGFTYFLFKTDVKESSDKDPASFKDLIGLLKKKTVLFCFIAIALQVGIDAGVAITTPKILVERTGMSISGANFVTSVYAMVRLAGCLGGAYILAKFSNKKIYMASIALILVGCFGLLFINSRILIYICTALTGLGISNLFAILFSRALDALPRKKNDISSLMIMGLVGGAILPPILGGAADIAGGQYGAIIVIMLCAGVMMYISKEIKDE